MKVVLVTLVVVMSSPRTVGGVGVAVNAVGDGAGLHRADPQRCDPVVVARSDDVAELCLIVDLILDAWVVPP